MDVTEDWLKDVEGLVGNWLVRVIQRRYVVYKSRCKSAGDVLFI